MIDIEAALAALSLADRCRLLAGATNWRTHAFDAAGIPAIKMSDGPNGVRGEGSGPDATPGVVVPAGITLGATWDTDLVGRIGELLGREAVRRNAHVLLAPTVNLHRTPVGGRTFECLSEDPELSGRLAVAYVRGVQSHEVSVTVKHFVGNDTEVDRMTVDVRADERTLREVYLRPFELAIRDGGAWGVMSSYNRVHGEYSASSRWLLTDVLRNEWGFDGVVVSDWYGAHETVKSAHAGLNVEMPGPARVYGARLEAAVERGEVGKATVEELVRQLLVLANRTRADERLADGAESAVDDPTERALTRQAAIAGTVLLRNTPPAGAAGDRPVLPLDLSQLHRIAVIGPNATVDRSIGGGSASLPPFGRRTFLDALTARVAEDPAGVTVSYHEGVRIERLTRPFDRTDCATSGGERGLAVDYFNGDDVAAPAVVSAVHDSGLIRFFGSLPNGIDPEGFGARVRSTFTTDVDGVHEFGIVSTGGSRFSVTVDGVEHVVLDDPDRTLPRSEEFFGYGHDEAIAGIELAAGQTVELAADWTNLGGKGFAALRLGVRRPEPTDLLDDAVGAAAAADAAVVMVGTNDEWETEGFDRTMLELPGDQDELVERIVAANPNTVVIVNAGSPVALGWASDQHPRPAPAVLTSFFAGQEQAEALVDVVLGVEQPGGRLPVTYPRRLSDTPAFLDHRPDHATAAGGVQFYAEGPFVGHRWYEARHITPHFWFGHGLGYAAALWGAPSASHTSLGADAVLAGDATLGVTVELTGPGGTRPAVEVVQGYVRPVAPGVRRPHKWLADFAKVVVPPGGSAVCELRFGADAFRHWDVPSGTWSIDPGEYEIVVARSADPDDECGRVRVSVVR